LELKPINFLGSIYNAKSDQKGIFVIEFSSLRNMDYSTTYILEDTTDFIGFKSLGNRISTDKEKVLIT